jgi:hypothetical protein
MRMTRRDENSVTRLLEDVPRGISKLMEETSSLFRIHRIHL